MRILAFCLALLASLNISANCLEDGSSGERLACFDRLATCAAIAADADRMSCYVAGGQGPLAVATPAKGAIERAFPPPSSSGEVDGEPPVLEATIIEVQKNAHGEHYLTLSNGHVWREKTPSRIRFKVGQAINIKKGALNSNQLRVEGIRRMVTVERVK